MCTKCCWTWISSTSTLVCPFSKYCYDSLYDRPSLILECHLIHYHHVPCNDISKSISANNTALKILDHDMPDIDLSNVHIFHILKHVTTKLTFRRVLAEKKTTQCVCHVCLIGGPCFPPRDFALTPETYLVWRLR